MRSLTSKLRKLPFIASILVVSLFGLAAPAQAAAAEPFPRDGVVFGDPGAPGSSAKLDLEPQAVVAELDVADGKVTFLSDASGLATLIVGPESTFAAARSTATVGELYQRYAPRGAKVPAAVLEAFDEPLAVYDPQTGVGDDTWADGCDSNQHGTWTAGFDGWVAQSGVTPDWTEHHNYSTENAELGDFYGYFGGTDDAWLGVCLSQGVVVAVEILQATTGSIGGVTSQVSYQSLGAGERLLYQHHGEYTPWLYTRIAPIGQATHTGWDIFISAAGADSYAHDDVYVSNG